MSKSQFQNKFKISDNPFAKKCENCNPYMAEIILNKVKAVKQNSTANTYIKIEKFKDDNYD